MTWNPLSVYALWGFQSHISRTSAKFASMPAGPLIPAHLSERIYQQVGLATKDSQRRDCRIKKRRLDLLSVEVLLVRMKSNGACNKACQAITFKQPFTLSPSARLKAVQFQETKWERNKTPKCWVPATALHQKSSDHKECECSPWAQNYSTFMSRKLPTSSKIFQHLPIPRLWSVQPSATTRQWPPFSPAWIGGVRERRQMRQIPNRGPKHYVNTMWL